MDTRDNKKTPSPNNYSKEDLISDINTAMNMEKNLFSDSTNNQFNLNKTDNLNSQLDIISKALDDLCSLKDALLNEMNNMDRKIDPILLSNFTKATQNLHDVKNFISTIKSSQEGQQTDTSQITGMLDTLSSTISSLEGISQSLSQQNTAQQSTEQTDTGQNGSVNLGLEGVITRANLLITNINSIKEGLVLLFLNPQQLVYFNTCISPLLTILDDLSTTSLNLSTTVNFLATSCIVCAKHSKLKDTLHLVYDMNEECEDIFKALKKRIDLIIQLCC